MSGYKQAREWLAVELPNIQAAWDWATEEQRHVQLKDSAFALHKLLEVTNRDEEAVALFSGAAEHLDETNPEHQAALGYALIGMGALHRYTSGGTRRDQKRAIDLLERGLALLRPLGEDLGAALALSWLGIMGRAQDDAQARRYLLEGFPIARRVGNPHVLGRYISGLVFSRLRGSSISDEEGLELWERAVREQREAGDPFQLISAIGFLGHALIHQGYLDRGKALLSESLELAREYRVPEDSALRGMAEASLMSGELDEAEAFAAEQLQLARGTGHLGGQGAALGLLTAVATRRGDLVEAEGFFIEASRIFKEGGDIYLRSSLGFLAELRIAQGRAGVAAGWLGWLVHQRALTSYDRTEVQRILDSLRDQVPPEELAAAVARGKELILDDVINDLLPTL